MHGRQTALHGVFLPISSYIMLHRIAIVGSSGYTGEELLSLCLHHSEMEVTAITSRQYQGQALRDALGVKGKYADLTFEDLDVSSLKNRADVFFLALPHGVASGYAIPLLEAGKKVIDLSADFRLKNSAHYREYYRTDHPAPSLLEKAVYGFPERYRKELRGANLIACPGCYPTSIFLSLVPLLEAGLIECEQIIINSLSGISGAGKRVELAYLFAESDGNIRAYNIPTHRHLPEIEQELSFAAGKPVQVSFMPHMAPMKRGMHTTISAPFCSTSLDEVAKVYQTWYEKNPFVRVLTNDLPQTRRVIHTNNAEIAYRHDARTGRLILLSAIDNLGKGAAGQAVQAFNLCMGLNEQTGLTSWETK